MARIRCIALALLFATNFTAAGAAASDQSEFSPWQRLLEKSITQNSRLRSLLPDNRYRTHSMPAGVQAQIASAPSERTNDCTD